MIYFAIFLVCWNTGKELRGLNESGLNFTFELPVFDRAVRLIALAYLVQYYFGG
jgi:hypothetical protein